MGNEGRQDFNGNKKDEENTERDHIYPAETQKSNRRILYFCDGTLDEFSDSDSEVEMGVSKKENNVEINMGFSPLNSCFISRTNQIAWKSFKAVEQFGETLAKFLGITAPKYISEDDIILYRNNVENEGNCDSNNTEQWNCMNYSNQVITQYPRLRIDKFT